MVTSELLAELHRLDRAEKLQIVQVLVNELVAEEATLPLVREPFPKYDMLWNAAAAEILSEMLRAAEAEESSPTRG